LASGNYTIWVSDAGGCISTTNVTISEPSAIELDSTATPAICGNTGTASVTAIGGTPSYTYFWNGGETTSTITNLAFGTYTCTVSDANFCTAEINVIVPDGGGSANVNIISTNVSCFGQATGSITATLSIPDTSYTWYWSHNGGLNDSIANNLTAGTYYVTITSNTFNCGDNDSIVITQPDEIALSISSYSDSKCNGDATGYIITSANGGTPSYSYNWSNGSINNNLVDVTAGTYNLTVTDANGCTETISQTLVNPTTLSLSDSIYYDNYYGNIIITAIGGTPNYTYNWSNGELFPTNNNLISGDYYITVTDANGCEYTNLYTIEIPLEIPSVITPNADGKNDILRITNIESVSNVKINIFNRWGDLVFNYEGTGYNYLNSQWDGTFNGTELPMATYVYIVEVEINSEKTQYNGTVTIVR
jgi:gliding motility-associated-like protein